MLRISYKNNEEKTIRIIKEMEYLRSWRNFKTQTGQFCLYSKTVNQTSQMFRSMYGKSFPIDGVI